MKISFLIITVIFIAFACQNTPKEEVKQTEEPIQKEEIAKVNVQKLELSIDGMTCTGCENAIQKTIDEFDGVYFSKANHIDGIAIIEIDSTKVDILKVEEAINELGYSAKGHKILSE